jgi:hypothetical protein
MTLINSGVDRMEFWIFFLKSLSWWLWLGMLLFWCVIYFLFIAPAIYRFWILPKIEKRYRTELKINGNDYYAAFASWTIPPMETSFYIFLKFMKWKWKNVFERPAQTSLCAKLNKINYDINTASKQEVIISFITVFFFNCTVLLMIILSIYFWTHPQA